MKDLQYCHSGLSGILLRFLSACAYIGKDSRRVSLAGMTLRCLFPGVSIDLFIVVKPEAYPENEKNDLQSEFPEKVYDNRIGDRKPFPGESHGIPVYFQKTFVDQLPA